MKDPPGGGGGVVIDFVSRLGTRYKNSRPIISSFALRCTTIEKGIYRFVGSCNLLNICRSPILDPHAQCVSNTSQQIRVL